MQHPYIIAALIPLIIHTVMAITALQTLTTHPRNPYTTPLVFYIAVNAILAVYVAVGISIVPRQQGPYYRIVAVFLVATELMGIILSLWVDKSITLYHHASFLPYAITLLFALFLP